MRPQRQNVQVYREIVTFSTARWSQEVDLRILEIVNFDNFRAEEREENLPRTERNRSRDYSIGN